MTFQVSFPSLQDRETALETLVILAELGQDEPVRAGVATLHPADIAELLDALEEPEVKQKVFRFLDPDLASAVLSFVSPRTQAELTEELSSAALGELVERLDSDDAADLLAALPEAQARAVLEQVPQELSAEMEQLLRYPPDTAGGIMQTEHVAVPAGTPVEQAIEIIRGHIDEVPDIHNVFVVDRERRLVGVLPLRKLILARPHDLVEQLMDRQVISARVDLDQEQVARLFKRYDLVSVPVVDASGTLLGRITVDDVVDVLEEEASEDIYRLAGLGGEEPVLDSPWRSIRRRLPWLGLNLVTTTLSATVISFFEGTIQAVAIAAAFMTIVAAQGGERGDPNVDRYRARARVRGSQPESREACIAERAVSRARQRAGFGGRGRPGGVSVERGAAAGGGVNARAAGEPPRRRVYRQHDSFHHAVAGD